MAAMWVFHTQDIFSRCIIAIACFTQIVFVEGGLTVEIGPEERLYRDLKDNAINTVPRKDMSRPTQVNISFSIFQILSLFWINDFIRWDPADYGGVTKTRVYGSEFWTPDILLTNSVSTMKRGDWTRDNRVTLTHDGTMNWFIGGLVETSCSIDMEFFPFDEQVCFINVTSGVFTQDEVLLVPNQDKALQDLYKDNGEWNLEKTDMTAVSLLGTANTSEAYSSIVVGFYLKRKPMYYVANIIMPCLVLSIISSFVFWIPADAGEKISFSITVLLSYTVFILMIGDTIPRTSDITPILVQYLLRMMLLTAASTIGAIATLRMHHNDSRKPVPNWVRKVIMEGLGRALCFRYIQTDVGLIKGNAVANLPSSAGHKLQKGGATLEYDHESSAVENIIGKGISGEGKLEQFHVINEAQTSEESDWKIIAQILDRLFFIISLCAMVFSSLALFTDRMQTIKF